MPNEARDIALLLSLSPLFIDHLYNISSDGNLPSHPPMPLVLHVGCRSTLTVALRDAQHTRLQSDVQFEDRIVK